jgi:uncharacterized RDD family membrane protein YckC
VVGFCYPVTRAFAAQNEQVILICSECGALLFEAADNCPFCDASLAETNAETELAAVAARPEPEAGTIVTAQRQPEWRREINHRVNLYRAKRYPDQPEESQSPFPFHAGAEYRKLHEEREPEGLTARAKRKSSAKPMERMEIAIVQPQLDFSSSPGDRARPQTALIPVASLAERRYAAALDGLFLLVSCFGFLGLFHSLGGKLALAKTEAAVFVVTFFLLYGLYFSIFTVFGGATPGMMLRGLSAVRLDGWLPDSRQLAWRSFGYLLSGGALALGFAWSLWDEDQFTWHDRISRTYITAAEPLGLSDPFDGPINATATRQTLAHK